MSDDTLQDLLSLCKQCLSIIDTATAKDDEITLHIKAAVVDMERQGIYAESYIDNELIRVAIVMFVKSNFGMVSANEKERAAETYKNLCTDLSLSSEFTEESDE